MRYQWSHIGSTAELDGKVEVPKEVPQWYHIGYTPEFDGKDEQGRLVQEVEPSPKRCRKKKTCARQGRRPEEAELFQKEKPNRSRMGAEGKVHLTHFRQRTKTGGIRVNLDPDQSESDRSRFLVDEIRMVFFASGERRPGPRTKPTHPLGDSGRF